MAEGYTFKRCSCRDEAGKERGRTCPKLRRAGGGWSNRHGSWYYQIELPPTGEGKRRAPLRRGGFTTVQDAEAELGQARELLAIAYEDDPQARIEIADLIVATVKQTRTLPEPEIVRRKVRKGQDLQVQITVGEWLEDFLKRKKKIEPTTRRSYESHVRLYLKPYLGRIRLDRLRVADVADMFEAIEEYNDVIRAARASGDPELRARVKYRRVVGPSSKHRIRATLRHALNIAIKQERWIDFNPAAVIELPDKGNAKPKVWTAERVKQWQADHAERLAGERERRAGRRVGVVELYIAIPRPSPVMVWTPAHTSVFLAEAAKHRLFALYRLIALRGLRRGEACGLRWTEVNFEAGTVGICWQITQLGWNTVEGTPKTEASDRVIALDEETLKILKAHRIKQAAERLAAGPAWVDSGFVFTNPDGSRLHPHHATDQFQWLAYTAGLPPIRLHDLRHGAASLMLAAGLDVKIVQETLGHTSSTFTRDTYTSVYTEVAKAAAEQTASMIHTARLG
ncbi:tyrosine-type recombinase/integrase [Streptosporangium soli]|nr:site-specific integrase [Streptosporangium sp. KLBMP 9127]